MGGVQHWLEVLGERIPVWFCVVGRWGSWWKPGPVDGGSLKVGSQCLCWGIPKRAKYL